MTTAGRSPASGDFGPNEWLVDEIYQSYLQDLNSVDHAWWDLTADYQPGHRRRWLDPRRAATAAAAHGRTAATC